MKGVHMKAPALTQIYTQKMLHQVHKKKLQQIREQRKSFIENKQSRLAHIQYLKQNKSKSFAHKFNQHSSEISRQNLKFLVRLEKTKPYFRYTSQDYRQNRQNIQKSRESSKFITPFIKKQNIQKQKQNLRLSNRVHSMSSQLNQNNLMKDFVKSQRIKQRITRYAAENNKITLKSQKYLSNLSNSKLETSSEHTSIRPKTKSTAANYYNKDEILKNKIQNVGKSLRRAKNRANSTLDENNEQNRQSFFSTQPLKNIVQGKFSRK